MEARGGEWGEEPEGRQQGELRIRWRDAPRGGDQTPWGGRGLAAGGELGWLVGVGSLTDQAWQTAQSAADRR